MKQVAERLPFNWTAGYSVITGLVVLLVLAFLSIIKLELVVNGLFLGAIIALGAIGLSLIYGIHGFAHIVDTQQLYRKRTFASMTQYLILRTRMVIDV